MNEVDLSRLNGQSFEKMVRALAFGIFGPQGVVFSAGPDGGRDFNISGKICNYPDWDGYLVLQSKFKSNVNANSDVTWLINQLVDERKAYSNSDSKRKIPEYYIIATNVKLSGSDGMGTSGKTRTSGYEKVVQEMETWVSQFKLKGYDIWHFDKIEDLLSNNSDVRAAFAAWITPGDVLHKVLQSLSDGGDNFGSTIERALIASVRRNLFTTLSEAGNFSDLKIRTSQVIIDLPISDLAKAGPDSKATAENKTALTELIERARDRHVIDQGNLIHGGSDEKNKRGRVVLMGGPGQGKSTISTFLAQAFRSAILVDSDLAKRDEVYPNIKDILSTVKDCIGDVNLPRRYPVWISLPNYADKISESRLNGSRPSSLIRYLAAELSDVADAEVSGEQVRKWLAKHPWIIVLDGLDEVPASGERAAIIDAIAGLNTEISQNRSDCLVIVTTRPQGYNNDLDRSHWDHLELSDLSKDQAVEYSRKLGMARYPDDAARRDVILSKVMRSTEEPSTARLMISPLQTTILYLIVDVQGAAPTSRWSLFNEYYEVLRKRERAKNGEVGAILERNWVHLGPIHQRAGLILQVLSEKSGQANSFLKEEQFYNLVEKYFSSLGYIGEELRDRTAELTKTALERLVLLSARQEGMIGFGVRSLQEYMAASALTSGDTGNIKSRLQAISGISHWRHVFQISCSRFFAEDALHHLMPLAASLPRELETSSADQLARNGARLALSLFEDGVGADHPVVRKTLAKHAFDLLGALPSGDSDLAALLDDQTADLLVECIRQPMQSSDRFIRAEAWALAIRLSNSDTRFRDLCIELWPNEVEIAATTVDVSHHCPDDEVLRHKIRSALFSKGISNGIHFLDHTGGPWSASEKDAASWNEVIIGTSVRKKPTEIHVKLLGSDSHYISVNSVANADFDDFDIYAEESFDFDFFKSVREFCKQPHAVSLIKVLESVDAKVSNHYLIAAINRMPWPLGGLLEFALDGNSVEDLIVRARNLEFGDIDDWLAAEMRWEANGIVEHDLATLQHARPWGNDISERGAPSLRHLHVAFNPRDSEKRGPIDIILSLCKIGRNLNPADRESLADAVVFSSMMVRSNSCSEIESAYEILEFAKFSRGEIFISFFSMFNPDFWSDARFSRLSSEICARGCIASQHHYGPRAEALINAFARNPTYRGLIPLIAMSVVHEDARGPDSALNILRKVNVSTFYPKVGDTGCIKVAALFLTDCLLADSGSSSGYARFASAVVDWLNIDSHWSAHLICYIIKTKLIDLDDRIAIACALVRLGHRVSSEHLADFRLTLVYLVDERISGLAESKNWRSLNLFEDVSI